MSQIRATGAAQPLQQVTANSVNVSETTQNITTTHNTEMHINADQVNILVQNGGAVPANMSLEEMKAQAAILQQMIAKQETQVVVVPQQPIYPQPSSSEKQEAYQQLRNAENKDSDARANFQLVLDGRQPHESLSQVTQAFLDVLRAEGGSNNTPGAQNAFRAINELAGRGIPRNEATQAYIMIRNSENKPEDALNNFRQLMNAQRPGESLYQMAQDFNQILRAEGGSNNTPNAQNAFRAINNSLVPGENRNAATQAYILLRNAENEGEHAVQNYNYVAQTQGKGHSRYDAAESFNRILRAEGGSRNSAEAQSAFSAVSQSLRIGESLLSATDTYVSLRNAENDNDGAVGNYRLIDSLLQSGESRTAETESFNSILRSEGGSRKTAEARSAYRTIKQW